MVSAGMFIIFLRTLPSLSKKDPPNLAAVLLGEVGVIEKDMETGNESVVEGANAVCCQK